MPDPLTFLVPAILLADYSLVSIKNPSSDVLRMGELLKVTPDGEYIFIFNKYEMDKLKKERLPLHPFLIWNFYKYML